MSKTVDVIANAIRLAMNGESMDVIHGTLSELDNVEVKIWREDKSIPLPIYAKEGDACMDVYAHSIEHDSEKDRIIVHTGLHFALPKGYEMELRPRSNLTKTEWYIPNAPGTLDEGYRGELMMIFKRRTSNNILNSMIALGCGMSEFINKNNIEGKEEIAQYIKDGGKFIKNEHSITSFPYKVGDRICQLLIRRKENIIWNVVSTKEKLGTTERGDGGFGSTNKPE